MHIAISLPSLAFRSVNLSQSGIAMTFAIFRTAEKNPQFFMKKDGYHSFSRARQHMWINGKKVQLDPSDPGGEHE